MGVIKIPGDRLYKILAKLRPGLSVELQQASMPDTSLQFIRKTFMTSMYLAFGISFTVLLFLHKYEKPIGFGILLFPILLSMFYFYFIQFPFIKILRIEREIDKEIIYAGRFLVIELESGIPIYDSFIQVADNYPIIGKYFQNIVDDIDLGTPVELALNNAIETTPSHNFRRLLWQIINSMSTGADAATSIGSVLEQISREQKVQLTEYGRKLNPLAMFYMIIAVILPSIGITMFVILISFLSIQLSLTSLLFIAAFMGFIQFLFYTVIKSSRPAYQME